MFVVLELFSGFRRVPELFGKMGTESGQDRSGFHSIRPYQGMQLACPFLLFVIGLARVLCELSFVLGQARSFVD